MGFWILSFLSCFGLCPWVWAGTGEDRVVLCRLRLASTFIEMEVYKNNQNKFISEIRLRGLLADVTPATRSALENNHAEIRFYFDNQKINLDSLLKVNSSAPWTHYVHMDDQLRVRTARGYRRGELFFSEQIVPLKRELVRRNAWGYSWNETKISLVKPEDDPEFIQTTESGPPASTRRAPTRLDVFLSALQRMRDTSELIRNCEEA